MDFNLSPEIEDFRLRIRDFVADHVIPLESDKGNFDEHEMLLDGPVRVLREKAKADGLWCLQMPKARGGTGPGPGGNAVGTGSIYILWRDCQGR